MERRYAKRNCRAIKKLMDKSMGYLLGLSDIFKTQHPLEAEALQAIAKLILAAEVMLEKFYIHTWGSLPYNWNEE
jgi:hypothetical protein